MKKITMKGKGGKAAPLAKTKGAFKGAAAIAKGKGKPAGKPY